MKTKTLNCHVISKEKAMKINGGEEDKPKLKQKFKPANPKVETPVTI